MIVCIWILFLVVSSCCCCSVSYALVFVSFPEFFLSLFRHVLLFNCISRHTSSNAEQCNCLYMQKIDFLLKSFAAIYAWMSKCTTIHTHTKRERERDAYHECNAIFTWMGSFNLFIFGSNLGTITQLVASLWIKTVLHWLLHLCIDVDNPLNIVSRMHWCYCPFELWIVFNVVEIVRSNLLAHIFIEWMQNSILQHVYPHMHILPFDHTAVFVPRQRFTFALAAQSLLKNSIGLYGSVDDVYLVYPQIYDRTITILFLHQSMNQSTLSDAPPSLLHFRQF